MIVNNGHWKEIVHWERRRTKSQRASSVFKENEWPPSVFFFFLSFLPRVPKNKKSVFYVFYGTLHPKVECQFEFFSININYEAVSSRKSSVRSVHKYQGSIRPSVTKIGKGEENQWPKCYQCDYRLWGTSYTQQLRTHTLYKLTLVISIDAA